MPTNMPLKTLWPPPFSLGELYYTLFRHKGKVLAALAGGLIAALAVRQATPTVYRSGAKLLVRYVKETTELEPGTALEAVRSPDERGRNIMNSEIEILTCSDLAERAVEQIGVSRFPGAEDTPEGRLVLARKILAALLIETPGRSNVIALSFDGPTPELAQATLQAIIDNYLRKHIEVHRPPASYELLARQTTEMAAKLAQTEEELRRVRQQFGVISLQEAKTLLANRSDELMRSLQDAEVSLSSAVAQLDVLRAFPDQAAMLPPPAGGAEEPSLFTGGGYTTLSALRARERELLATYTPDSIPVRDIRRQIEAFQRRLEEALKLVEDTNMVSMTAGEAASLVTQLARVSSIKARIRALKEQLDLARREAARLDEAEGRILELQRRQKTEEDSYLYFSQNLEKARLEDILQTGRISNINVLQPATRPAAGFRPSAARNMALLLALGLLAGVALAFGMEALDHSMKRPAEAEAYLNIPVLVSVPVVRGMPGSAAAAKQLLCAATLETGAQRAWPLCDGLLPYVEALHNEAVKLVAAQGGRTVMLGLAGCRALSGVSSLAAAWAVMLARDMKLRVALADARTPPSPAAVPAAAAIDRPAEGADRNPTPVPNLRVLCAPAGIADEGRPLRESEAMIASLRKPEYDFVIVDLPPVAETSVSVGLAHALDGVMLVIGAGDVRREQAQKARELLQRAGGKVLGVVFNRRRFYVPAWLYRSY